MSAADFLGRLLAVLAQAGVPYMIVGSFASSYHARPRTTQDLDIVIDPTPASLGRLLDLLPEDAYYVSREAAQDALMRRSQFNVIDFATGWKVDLILRKHRAFSEEEFRRRVPARILEHDVLVATAEDTVVAKLEWATLGESERQLRDVESVVEVQAGALDRDYVERWANALGVTDAWNQINEKKPR